MSKKAKIVLGLIAVFLLVILAMVVYRIHFQFSNSAVNAFIQAEAAKYTSNPVKAGAIIQDAVNHILSERHLTREVLNYSSATGIQKEQVLVTAAVMQAKSYGYLE